MAVERDDRAVIARLRVAQRHGMELRSNAIVVAQMWFAADLTGSPSSMTGRRRRLALAVRVEPIGRDQRTIVRSSATREWPGGRG